jgi:hypothetical protein
MKSFFPAVCLLVFALPVSAQNTATVTGSNIIDLNGAKLANGQICFLATDNTDAPISFQQGGGGQVLRRQFCSAVNAGVITSFTVPNPANTLPSGIYYRVTVKDTSTGAEVLHYTGVTFSGTSFNFDTYTPVLPGVSLAPLTGTSVAGNLGVSGNISVTGSLTASNIPAFIPGAGSCTSQFVTALNAAAAPTCSNTISGVLTINGSANLTTTGTGGQTAGGFATPSAIRHYCGDGTGWRCEFAKRTGSVDTLEAWITDTGVVNAVSGFQVNGAALNFSNLAGTASLATQVTGTLPPANGGTGQTTATAALNALSPMTTLGDIVYASAANTASRLAGNITTTKKFLAQTGTGTVSAAPTWVQPASTDLSDGPFLTASGTATVTNKTISGASNTLTLTPNHQMFTASGTFTIPAGVTAVKVTVVAGGGAGGGATTTSSAAGGGAAGGAAIKWLTGLTPGNTLAVTVGSGGTGVANGAGNTGGASSVASGTQTITTITANGGGGGQISAQPGAPGPVGSGGDLNLQGSAGTIPALPNLGGTGGGSLFGGGGPFGLAGPGGPGGAPGAGGGGAGGTASTTVPGGNGANGIVIFEWVN